MAKKKSKPAGDSEDPKPPGGSKPKARPKSASRLPAGATGAAKPGAGGSAKGEAAAARKARARAESLLHKAFSADEPAEVVAFAREALDTWPDCADAYVLIAEHARGPKEAMELYARGVEAAERELGPGVFREGEGHFWLLMETRPYMRARHGLAQTLWMLGRRDEAVGHYAAMLVLNPNDNQGIRYNLAAALFEVGREDELAELLGRYPEDGSASWAYSAALLAFRRHGDSPAARKVLGAAKKSNRFVPDFLTGREMLPSRLPDMIGIGDRSEAIDYCVGFLNSWRTTPGAIAWLRSASSKKPPTKSKPKVSKGPTVLAKTKLKKLPQPAEASWQAEARRLPVWMNIEGELRRPWIVLVVSRTDDLILGQEVVSDAPSANLLWDKVAEAMTSPAMGDPHRPRQVEVRPQGDWDSLAGHLDDIGVDLTISERLGLVDSILETLVEHVCGKPAGPGLLEMPGVNAAQVASFFRAAAGFYREAPWQRVGGSETIKIACDRFESGPWYAVVIGQMGMTLGLALYENFVALLQMRDSDSSDEQNARETVALSVTYGDQTEIPVTDLDAAERHGWEVAGPDAYPAPIRKERGLVMRPPLAWELRLLEACLRAIPRFVDGHDRADAREEDYEVETGTGPLTVRLSWVMDLPVG